MLDIAGIQKLTLLDDPGFVACTVFMRGCNFRCPFCQNAPLVIGGGPQETLPEEALWKLLDKRSGILESVVVSGGEPLLQKELPELLRTMKKKGFRVKLDTNGSFPARLRELIEAGLVDAVAMDIKNSPAQYERTAGCAVDLSAISESIALLLEGHIPYEFRTTAVKELHTAEDFLQIGAWIAGAEQYYIQCFRDSGALLTEGLSAPSEAALQAFLEAAKKYIPQARLRGVS